MTSFILKKQAIHYAHLLNEKGFVANHDGNISARLPGELQRFIATPTGRSKRDLKEADLLTIELSGKTRAGAGHVFSEWIYHAEIYQQLPQALAIVHAHPPHASAYGLGGQSLPIDFWPEGVISLGCLVPCVISKNPSQLEVVVELGVASRSSSAALVQGNGMFAWGKTIEQAYLRLELVEHLAQIFVLAQRAGTFRQLPHEAVTKLLSKRKQTGLAAPEEVFHVL